MNTLLYLRESMANYAEDNPLAQKLYNKLAKVKYVDEESFLETLSEKEIAYLNNVLQKEMKYAQEAQDNVRAKQLNEIYQII